MQSLIPTRLLTCLPLLLSLLSAGCTRQPWPPTDPVTICKRMDAVDFSGFPGLNVTRRGADRAGDPVFLVFPPDTTVEGFYRVLLHEQDGTVKETDKEFLSDTLGIDFGQLTRAAALVKYVHMTGIAVEADADLLVVPYPVEHYRLFRRAAPSHPLPHPSHLWKNIYKNWYLEDQTNR